MWAYYRLFAKEELNKTIDKINDIRQQMTDMFAYRGGYVPWDVTAHQRFHTQNRYDVLRWTLLTNNHTYLAYDYENAIPIKGRKTRIQLRSEILSSQ